MSKTNDIQLPGITMRLRPCLGQSAAPGTWAIVRQQDDDLDTMYVDVYPSKEAAIGAAAQMINNSEFESKNDMQGDRGDAWEALAKCISRFQHFV